MADLFPCPICRVHEYLTRQALVDHLVDDHSPAVVAEEYLKARAAHAATCRTLTRERMCGKFRYRDEQAATEALLKAWRSMSPRRRELRAYQCDRCDGWHLTSQPADTSSEPAAAVS